MDQPRASQSRRTSHGDVPPGTRPEDAAQGHSSTVLFREIHKNAWLKKLPSVERRIGAFPKKGERVWVVFCVHDDSEAFLELYSDQKVAVAHKPDWFVSLNNCLHVSPTICPQEDEYEFVVTLSSDLVRLTAPSWDLMIEWVETIRSKLREMKILSPRENVYSKMPEARLPLAPTRDPNSPLPPPPVGPSTVLPGVEPVHSSESSDSSSSVGSVEGSTSADSSSDDSSHPPQREAYDNVSLQMGSASSSLYITHSEPPVYTRQHQALSRALSVPETPTLYSTSLHSTPSSGSSGRSDNNVTVIEVSSEQLPPSNEQGIFNFSFIADSLVPPLDATTSNTTFSEDLNTQEVNELYYTPPVTPARPSDRSSRTSTVSVLSNASAQISLNSGEVRIQERTNPSNVNNNSLDTEPLSVLNSHYECVFLSPIINSPIIREDSVSVSTGTTTRIQHGSAIPEDNSNSRLPETSRSQPGNSLVEERSQVVPSSQESSTGDHQMRRRRSSSTSEGNLAQHVPTRPITVPGSERSRIILGGTSPRVEVERRLQPAPHPYRQVQQATPGGSVELVGSNRLTLREQQVLQLRREMLHPGGVRLQLRRKDCTGSIALVDAFGAVWVAGWKQREHPMLYNALHIGDQVLSTAGIMVQSAADAQKLIRGATSLYVEFIIRRVPFGRVFAIRRDTEGQSLGIIQEGNTAEIRDIVSGSPAARHGLSPRAQTCDGLSLTNWVLTEINGRPLNLFFKDAEVRDRLNAVGREISILVQPFDLVRQLKKQLKAIRGYKDYILQ